MKQLAIKFDPEHLKEVQKLAAGKGLTSSAVIRRAVAQMLAREPGEQTFRAMEERISAEQVKVRDLCRKNFEATQLVTQAVYELARTLFILLPEVEDKTEREQYWVRGEKRLASFQERVATAIIHSTNGKGESK